MERLNVVHEPEIKKKSFRNTENVLAAQACHLPSSPSGGLVGYLGITAPWLLSWQPAQRSRELANWQAGKLREPANKDRLPARWTARDLGNPQVQELQSQERETVRNQHTRFLLDVSMQSMWSC